MCYPSANLPPLESIIWLFIWSTNSSAVRLNAAGCEQMLKCELAALWPQLHTASSRDALSCAIQTHSDDHRQRDITSSVLFSDMEIRSSWSPGGGYNSDTWHRSEADIRGYHRIGHVHVCQHVCAFSFYHLGNGFDFTHMPALFDLPLTICVLLCVISISLEQLICAMRWVHSHLELKVQYLARRSYRICLCLESAPIDYPAWITEVWLFIEDQTRAAIHG